LDTLKTTPIIGESVKVVWHFTNSIRRISMGKDLAKALPSIPAPLYRPAETSQIERYRSDAREYYREGIKNLTEARIREALSHEAEVATSRLYVHATQQIASSITAAREIVEANAGRSAETQAYIELGHDALTNMYIRQIGTIMNSGSAAIHEAANRSIQPPPPPEKKGWFR
jgi:hypothetical protein